MPGDHVDDGRWHEERRNLARVVAGIEKGLVLFLDPLESADAGTHDDAGTIQIDLLEVEPGVGHGIGTRCDAVMHELIDAPGFLGRKIFREFETLHCAAKAAGKVGGVIARDGRNAAHTVHDISPGGCEGAAHRRDNAHARDDYSTLAQAQLRISGKTMPAWPADARRSLAAHEEPVRRTIRPWRGDR
jgi:hypothetical protein